MRLLCVVVAVAVLSGCASAPPGGTAPTTDTTTTPSEPSTITLYLLFPRFNCDPLNGNTTYNSTVRYGACGWDDTETVPEKPCSFFKVHDPALRIHKGDQLEGRVQIEGGPGVMVTFRLIWRDDLGIVAEGSHQETVLNTLPGIQIRAMATRESSGPIQFEVYAENGRCQTTYVGNPGDGDLSRFTITRAS